MANSKSKLKSSLLVRFRKLLLGGALFLFVASVIFNLLVSHLGWYINISSSLPLGLYKAEYRSGVKAGLFGFSDIDDVEYNKLMSTTNHNVEEHRLVLSQELIDKTLKVDSNEIVLVCLDIAIAQFAYQRGYIASGKCPSGYAPVGKRVVARAGDEVKAEAIGILVNGKLIDNSKIVKEDAAKRSMPMYAEEGSSFVLDSNEIYLINSKDDSFDSRYFGPVKDFQVLAKLEPIFIF